MAIIKVNLNYKNMQVLSYSQRRQLPAQPGIYYIGNNSCPVRYVGLSCNLRKRHSSHHRSQDFYDISDVVICYEVLSEEVLSEELLRRTKEDVKQILSKLEKKAIQHYNPSLNGKRLNAYPQLDSNSQIDYRIGTGTWISCGTGVLILSL